MMKILNDSATQKNAWRLVLGVFADFSSTRSQITCLVNGTVRPDWTCMRVVSLESPLKGHQPLYVFNF